MTNSEKLSKNKTLIHKKKTLCCHLTKLQLNIKNS